MKLRLVPLLVAIHTLAGVLRADQPVDFVRDVQPILKNACWSCHGESKQKGGLRLDAKEPAFAGGESGVSIVPGKGASSLLIKLVDGSDPDRIMPAKGDKLTAAQIGTLRNWIDQGANWPATADVAKVTDKKDHWSFRPPARPVVPAIREAALASRIASPIDAFIAERLQKAGLGFSPEADRRLLIRRLTFDLTGLPPTPEEVDAFVADKSAGAYERVVDRLLASPAYGERWGRHWLDVVRFADTDGFETNQPRANAWRYRDWVIKSLNDDKPYDRFVMEQIAGDSLDADEATGFLVAGPWDRVKSPDPVLTAQQRADELNDMAATTGSAFLGLTVGCARCHDHKFDPISQRDYYSIVACMAGVQHGERPIHDATYAKRKGAIEALNQQVADISREVAMFEPKAQAARTIVIYPNDPLRTKNLQNPTGPVKLAAGHQRGHADDPGDVTRLPTLGAGYIYWKAKNKDVFAWTPGVTGRFRVWVSWGCGHSTHAPDARYILDQDGDLATKADQVEIGQADHRRFADGSGEPVGEKLWSGFRNLDIQSLGPKSRLLLRTGPSGAPTTTDVLLLEEIKADASAAPLSPHLRIPVSRNRNLERFDPIDAKFIRFEITATTQLQPCIDELEIFSAEPDSKNVGLASAGAIATASGTLPGYEIHQLAHLNDGRYGNEWSWISDERGRGWVQIELPAPRKIDRIEWSRDRADVPRHDDRLATEYVIKVSLDGKTWKAVASSEDRLPRTLKQNLKVPGGVIFALEPKSAPRIAELVAVRRKLQQELSSGTQAPMAYAGKFTKPGITRRMARGDVTQPRDEVAPGAIASIAPDAMKLDSADSEPQRRLALAKWIVDPGNPLTARVIVNRLWHYHFGCGLVGTPSDLGNAGGKPTHPELLDWLAAELPAQGWRLKPIHRLIVLSATYRQASASNPAGLAADAGSTLLWRYPPRRLEGEAIRDSILAASGQLDRMMGGPGFSLYKPTTNYVRIYEGKEEFGPEEFRRMVYQFKPRTQQDAIFGAFDCPDAAQITPKRNVSTTPLQALNLLNSRFMLDQSSFFAERVTKDAGAEIDAQIRRAFLLAFGRGPSPAELSASAAMAREHGLPMFCRVLLNANEFIYLD